MNKQNGKNKIMIGLALMGFMAIGLVIDANINKVYAPTGLTAQVAGSGVLNGAPVDKYINFPFAPTTWVKRDGKKETINKYITQIFDAKKLKISEFEIDITKCLTNVSEIVSKTGCIFDKATNSVSYYFFDSKLVENLKYTVSIYSLSVTGVKSKTALNIPNLSSQKFVAEQELEAPTGLEVKISENINTSTETSGVLQRIGNFFSNIFGGAEAKKGTNPTGVKPIIER